jgi:hypothetical protein
MNKTGFAVLLAAFISCGLTAQGTKTAAPSASPAKAPIAKKAPWAIQVEQVDSSAAALPGRFSVAIYEDLLSQVAKTDRFENVFRSGDHRAEGVPNLLVLKTSVVSFTEGSETKRAVTTVSGATKISVRMQLVARDGHVLVDKTVQGKVRFFGGNLRATDDLTKGMTKVLAETSLAE